MRLVLLKIDAQPRRFAEASKPHGAQQDDAPVSTDSGD